MMNWLSEFPGENALMKTYPGINPGIVNAHIHTPYSFSAFSDFQQIFGMANTEAVAVLGINDFFVTDGYEEFYREALKAGVFPLFNIEFTGLLKKEQQSGIRVNDPNNPGRCYFCGKGLNHPFSVSRDISGRLNKVIALSQDQVKAMIVKVNHLFTTLNFGLRLDYETVKKSYAKNLVRERHIAKAIRIAAHDLFSTEERQIEFYTKLFNGRQPKSMMTDYPSLENEIRSSLLKSGGAAFVEEDENTFMSIGEITGIILNAGGFPCYPVLLDDKSGTFTEFEQTPEILWNHLKELNVHCIEFIPGRNDASHLERYIEYFSRKNYIVLLGTEHNAPEMIALTPQTRGNKPLSPYLKKISYEGACVVAAHQYKKARGEEGYVDIENRITGDREYFVKLGNAVILHHKNTKN